MAIIIITNIICRRSIDDVVHVVVVCVVDVVDDDRPNNTLVSSKIK